MTRNGPVLHVLRSERETEPVEDLTNAARAAGWTHVTFATPHYSEQWLRNGNTPAAYVIYHPLHRLFDTRNAQKKPPAPNPLQGILEQLQVQHIPVASLHFSPQFAQVEVEEHGRDLTVNANPSLQSQAYVEPVLKWLGDIAQGA